MQSSPRIDELRQKFHENPRRYFAPLANEYRKAGDPEQAIAICRAHLAQQPAHMSGHVVYGQALYDARRTEEARVVFEKALALDPDNVVVLRQLGDIARQRGDSAEARHWYKRALDNEPYDAEIAAYVAELTEPVTVTEAAKPEPDLEIEEVGAEVPSSDPAADTTAAETSQDTVAPKGTPELEMAGGAPELPVADVAPDLEIAEVAPVSDVIDLPVTPRPMPADPDVPWRKSPMAEASPFVTRTMGELYAKQGYHAAALDVFRQLAIRHPEDRGLIDRIEELARLAARRTPPGSRMHDALEPAAQVRVEDNAPVADSPHAPVAEPMADGSVDTDAPSVTEKSGSLPVTVDPVSVDSATPSESVASEDDIPGSALIDWAGEPKPGEVEDSELPTAAADAGESGKHFTEVELGEGDSWDTDVWAAGFSREERLTFGDSEVEQSTDDEDAETEEAAAESAEAQDVDSEEDAESVEASGVESSEGAESVQASGVESSEGVESVQATGTDSSEGAKPAEAAGAEPAEAAGIDSEVVVDRPPSAEPEIATTRWSSHEQAEAVAAASFGESTDVDREPHATQTRHSADSESNLDEATAGASSHLVAYAPHAPSDSRAPESRPTSRTVQQFFAILGAHRPPSHKMAEGASDEMPLAASSSTLPASAHAFADLFPNASIAEEDRKAAFALSGALAAGRGDPASTPPRREAPRPLLGEGTPAAPLNTETEEDLRRFREWLDGLAES